LGAVGRRLRTEKRVPETRKSGVRGPKNDTEGGAQTTKGTGKGQGGLKTNNNTQV